ncbi:hypothetical protein GCM10023260_14720 [Bartonella acomydis]|uniref:EexN family lipoprotein n=1 Tax=Bartonella acomydis TaxID=686234 RepID=A0ABP9MV28_9HYPH
MNINKIIITTLLLCTGIITAGCEKNYSVAEFKKDQKLMEEWDAKCGFAGTSKNCENLRLAQLELEKEYEAKTAERSRKIEEKKSQINGKIESSNKGRYGKNESRDSKNNS